MIRVGLISDTHGRLRTEALDFLKGIDFILHAGDIGHEGIISELSSLAPVIAVRGNNDNGLWAESVPFSRLCRIGAFNVQVVHDIETLVPEDANIIVTGHSHRPIIRAESGIVNVNPGSAGPRRFKLPVTIGEMIINDSSLAIRIIDLEDGTTLLNFHADEFIQ